MKNCRKADGKQETKSGSDSSTFKSYNYRMVIPKEVVLKVC